MNSVIINIGLLRYILNPKYKIARLGCFYVTAILSWGFGWGWIEVDIEAEVDLSLGLKWGWDEIESKFSWNWVEISWHWINEEIGLS